MTVEAVVVERMILVAVEEAIKRKPLYSNLLN